MRLTHLVLSFAALGGITVPASAEESERPNIVIIYSDDVGVGDVGAYGEPTTDTPHLDRLAAAGLRFNQAFATSSTCTPSRYSVLTGNYPFRQRGTYILNGDAAMLIESGTSTLASVLNDVGYETAMIGKWHLGLGDGSGPINWNGDVDATPLDLGFDESFILPATNDRVPTVLMEGNRVVGLSADDPLTVSFSQQVGDEPTAASHPQLLKYPADGQHNGTIVNGISRIGWQSGGKSAWWDDQALTGQFVDRFKQFLDGKGDEPQFVFLSLHQVHTPRTPAEQFVDTSQTGLRGDSMIELDWAVGEVVSLLQERDMLDNTLLIFTSDNGAIFYDSYNDGSIEKANNHQASGDSRGGKYLPFEGGCRVPFLVHWPDRVEPGVSEHLFSQVDLMHSLAALTGAELPSGAAADSLNALDHLLGEADTGRGHVIQTAPGVVAFRRGDWKLIPGYGLQAWTVAKHNTYPNPLSTPGPSRRPMLFNLADDPGEQVNVAASHPEVVEELTAMLDAVKQQPERLAGQGD